MEAGDITPNPNTGLARSALPTLCMTRDGEVCGATRDTCPEVRNTDCRDNDPQDPIYEDDAREGTEKLPRWMRNVLKHYSLNAAAWLEVSDGRR